MNHKKYIVACSGGVDSIVLAHYLHSYDKLDSIFHFVFNEPKEFSNSAKQLVEEFCSKYCIPIYISFESNDNKGNYENKWRKERYRALEKITTSKGLLAATGHHMDDQMTSYILSLFKESSRCFIPPVNVVEGVPVIRPFSIMKWTKSKIIDYAKENMLDYTDDPFNYFGDRGTIDNLLPDLKKIDQLNHIFIRKYNNWFRENFKKLEHDW